MQGRQIVTLPFLILDFRETNVTSDRHGFGSLFLANCDDLHNESIFFFQTARGWRHLSLGNPQLLLINLQNGDKTTRDALWACVVRWIMTETKSHRSLHTGKTVINRQTL